MMYWTMNLASAPLDLYQTAVTIDTNIYLFSSFKLGRSMYVYEEPINIYVLDTETLEWSEVKPVKGQNLNFVSIEKMWQSVVAHESKIYVWGGRSKNNQRNGLYCFDTVSLEWSKPTVSGTIPQPRYGHSACLWGNNMYIYGGLIENENGFIEEPPRGLYVLNMLTMSWSVMETMGETPVLGRYHAANMIDDKMYIFGRESTMQSNVDTNKIFYLDMITKTWSYTITVNPGPKHILDRSIFVHEGILYILNGVNTFSKTFLEMVNGYDPKTSSWISKIPQGSPPSVKRHGHICQVVGDKVFIFGGRSLHYDEPRGIVNKKYYSGVHVLDLNPSLLTIGYVKTLEFIKENQIDMNSLGIPSKLKKDLEIYKPLDPSRYEMVMKYETL